MTDTYCNVYGMLQTYYTLLCILSSGRKAVCTSEISCAALQQQLSGTKAIAPNAVMQSQLPVSSTPWSNSLFLSQDFVFDESEDPSSIRVKQYQARKDFYSLTPATDEA